ncbi:hypothetical protein D3C85_1561250 [compost metagenome]
MLTTDLASLPVPDGLGRVAGNTCPGTACLLVGLAHGAGLHSGVIHQQPVAPNFEQMPDNRLRLLVDAHALSVDVFRHVVESPGYSQRWPSAEHRAH